MAMQPESSCSTDVDSLDLVFQSQEEEDHFWEHVVEEHDRMMQEAEADMGCDWPEGALLPGGCHW